MSYTPPIEILEKYAKVLINYALNSGEGVKKGEVVNLTIPECAKPFLVPLKRAIQSAGAHLILNYLPDDVENASFIQNMNEEQLDFFADKYYKGMVEQCDHWVNIIAEYDKYELKDVDPKRIMRRQITFKPYRVWRDEKENLGKSTWTLGMYGTPAMAAEVGMTEEEYWEQIILACYLDQPDPVAEWKKTIGEIERIRAELNKLKIEKIHLEAEGVDLWVGIGEGRKWLGGSGRNIPSFEIFISPDCRLTEGKINFNQPLYHYGNVIEGIELEFKAGKVISSKATKNQALLDEMLSSPNADKIGEFSLTDSRFSKITKPMGETLFDENMGGEQGNTHIAVGNAYKDSYTGDPSQLSKEEWQALGYNESQVHTDIVSTAKRTATAYLKDGSQQVIYRNGKFEL